jgi:putative effector of murein hydrolase
MTAPSATHLLWLGGTVLAYLLARRLHARAHTALRRAVPPLLLALVLLALPAWFVRADPATVRAGGQLLVWCLGPATVALAIPLVRSERLWREFPRVAAGVFAGCAVNIGFTLLVARLWHLTPVVEASLRPKTATAAIALLCAERSGGLASLGAAFAVMCGLLGSWLYPLLFRADSPALPLGVAVGTASHGIGTSRLASENRPPDADGLAATGASAFAMALAGFFTALLVWPWMR